MSRKTERHLTLTVPTSAAPDVKEAFKRIIHNDKIDRGITGARLDKPVTFNDIDEFRKIIVRAGISGGITADDFTEVLRIWLNKG